MPASQLRAHILVRGQLINTRRALLSAQVFEYMESTILEELEKHTNGLDATECKKCVYQLLRSIGYCHSNNIIHRDIKPENLLLSKHGILKLCDFGFARPLGGPGARYTDYVATRWYRSPELLVGDTQYGRGVDVWAIGCMLAEIHTGLPLFPGESDIDQLFHILRCQGNLTDHLSECLRKNPLFEGVEIPHIREPETLKRRFPRFEPDMIQFMQACLGNDPKTRASCADLLEQPYFDGFHDWWAQEFKKLCDKDGIGGRARYKKRSKEKKGGELNPEEAAARQKLDGQRKAMEDERQQQIKSLKAGLEIPAFNPNKNKEKKEKDRKERREREERERAAVAAKEAEVEEKRKRRKAEREEERRQKEERERAPQDDLGGVPQGRDMHGQLLADYDPTAGSSQQGDEDLPEGHLPNLRMSTPTAPGLLAFPQLANEDKENDGGPGGGGGGGHQRGQSRGRDRERDDRETRHELEPAASKEMAAHAEPGGGAATGGRKKKAPQERFGAAQQPGAVPHGASWDMRAPSPLMPHVGAGPNAGHDGNQGYHSHVGPSSRHELAPPGERVDPGGMGTQVHPGGMGWHFDNRHNAGGHKPPTVHGAKQRKKNLPSVGDRGGPQGQSGLGQYGAHGGNHNQFGEYGGYGASKAGLGARGGRVGGTGAGGVAGNTFDAYKPKTPNLVEKRPPMTPNFEPFGRCALPPACLKAPRSRPGCLRVSYPRALVGMGLDSHSRTICC
jgi:cyclin-dependent kinase-like